MTQPELHLPTRETNDILREKIKDIERDIIVAESRGYDAECQRLLKERTRLQKIIRAYL